MSSSCHPRLRSSLHLLAATAPLLLSLAWMPVAAQAHDDHDSHAGHAAHVHGVGKLDVALDGKTLSLHLDSPLMNLVGFEHAANSAADQQAVQKMAATLRDAGKLFLANPEAGCTLSSVKLESAAMGPALLGEKAAAPAARQEAGHDGHADLDGDFAFNCSQPERLRSMQIGLFEAFKGFQKIDVQFVTAKRQGAAQLLPGKALLNLQ
jgi:hypothetical protein